VAVIFIQLARTSPPASSHASRIVPGPFEKPAGFMVSVCVSPPWLRASGSPGRGRSHRVSIGRVDVCSLHKLGPVVAKRLAQREPWRGLEAGDLLIHLRRAGARNFAVGLTRISGISPPRRQGHRGDRPQRCRGLEDCPDALGRGACALADRTSQTPSGKPTSETSAPIARRVHDQKLAIAEDAPPNGGAQRRAAHLPRTLGSIPRIASNGPRGCADSSEVGCPPGPATGQGDHRLFAPRRRGLPRLAPVTT
jgi:hypothetical protein